MNRNSSHIWLIKQKYFVTTPTTTQHCSWVGYENDFAYHPTHHPTETQCLQYLSCYWPDFDETLIVGSWKHLEKFPTVTVTLVKASYVLTTFVHIRNISALIKLYRYVPNICFFRARFFYPNFFVAKNFLNRNFFGSHIVLTLILGNIFLYLTFFWPKFFFDRIFLGLIFFGYRICWNKKILDLTFLGSVPASIHGFSCG